MTPNTPKKKGKRFYTVTSPRGSTAHMAATRIEGGLTYCGRPVTTDWTWTTAAKSERPRCSQCLRRS